MKLLGKYIRSSGDKLLLLLLLLFFHTFAHFVDAQDNYPIGTRAAALANAVVMDSGIWSVYHNQAGLGDFHNFSIGFHQENKYITKENALHALVITVPVNSGTFGLSYTYFGFNLYNESKLGLGFGKSFGEKFSAGIQINYHYTYISPLNLYGEIENRHGVTVEGGIQYKPISTIRIGIHLFNPSRSHTSPINVDTLKTTLRAGLSYSPIEKLWMSVETEKSLNYNLQLKSGIEYEIHEGLYLRTGIITHPVQNTFGLGFKIKRINADIAFSHHPILGYTPHFSFDVRLR